MSKFAASPRHLPFIPHQHPFVLFVILPEVEPDVEPDGNCPVARGTNDSPALSKCLQEK